MNMYSMDHDSQAIHTACIYSRAERSRLKCCEEETLNKKEKSLCDNNFISFFLSSALCPGTNQFVSGTSHHLPFSISYHIDNNAQPLAQHTLHPLHSHHTSAVITKFFPHLHHLSRHFPYKYYIFHICISFSTIHIHPFHSTLRIHFVHSIF